jgi:hypothetical protein
MRFVFDRKKNLITESFSRAYNIVYFLLKGLQLTVKKAELSSPVGLIVLGVVEKLTIVRAARHVCWYGNVCRVPASGQPLRLYQTKMQFFGISESVHNYAQLWFGSLLNSYKTGGSVLV